MNDYQESIQIQILSLRTLQMKSYLIITTFALFIFTVSSNAGLLKEVKETVQKAHAKSTSIVEKRAINEISREVERAADAMVREEIERISYEDDLKDQISSQAAISTNQEEIINKLKQLLALKDIEIKEKDDEIERLKNESSQ